MDDVGVYVQGLLGGMDRQISEYDGKMKTKYRYLVICGIESYLVSSDDDYSGLIAIGSNVIFRVLPRCFGGTIYYTKGDLRDG